MGHLLRRESAYLTGGIIKVIFQKSNQNIMRHSEQFVRTFKWHKADTIMSCICDKP